MVYICVSLSQLAVESSDFSQAETNIAIVTSLENGIFHTQNGQGRVKKFGRNPKCDRDWIKLQRKKGNKSTKRYKMEIKVQIEVQRKKGNTSLKRKGK